MAVRNEAFLDLEQSLVRELEPRWNKIQNRIVAQITTAIRKHDLSKVAEILETINPELIYEGKLRRIRMLFKTAIVFGGTRIAGTTKGLHIVDVDAVMDQAGTAQKQFQIQIDQMVLTLKRRMMETAVKLEARVAWEERRAVEFSKGDDVDVQKVNPINLPNVLNAQAKSVGQGMINIASSLQMSRMAGYGFASEAHARGIVKYEITEVLDSRTCPVCRRMHGKVFEVKDALAKLDTQIRITDPNDLKILAPWPKQDKASVAALEKMTAVQLREKGFDTPPFHPLCRGLLKQVPNAAKLAPAQVDPRVTGLDELKQVNPRVAEFLDSVGGGNLLAADREVVIAASIGVTDYAALPRTIRKLIEANE